MQHRKLLHFYIAFHTDHSIHRRIFGGGHEFKEIILVLFTLLFLGSLVFSSLKHNFRVLTGICGNGFTWVQLSHHWMSLGSLFHSECSASFKFQVAQMVKEDAHWLMPETYCTYVTPPPLTLYMRRSSFPSTSKWRTTTRSCAPGKWQQTWELCNIYTVLTLNWNGMFLLDILFQQSSSTYQCSSVQIKCLHLHQPGQITVGIKMIVSILIVCKYYNCITNVMAPW